MTVPHGVAKPQGVETEPSTARIPSPGAEQRRGSGSWGYLVLALIVLNVVALAAWLIPTVTGTQATDRRLTDALTAVERVVETARDGSGRVPERLDHLLSRLPPDVARMVLDGDIAYRPSPDRSRYDLVPALRTSAPGR